MDYKPIDCNFYDELEALATLRKMAKITYMQEGVMQTVHAIITNLYTQNHVEYMTLSDGHVVRLDTLIEVDGKFVPGVC